MTGSAQYASQRGIPCCICNRPVSLETSKTDELGKAVHRECYVRKTISRFRTASAVPPSGNWLSSIVVRFYLRFRWTLLQAKRRNGNAAGLQPDLRAMSPRPIQSSAATFRGPKSARTLFAINT